MPMIFGLIFLFLSSAGEGIYFVSAGKGTDVGNCQSRVNPCKSISYTYSQNSDDDSKILNLDVGLYNETAGIIVSNNLTIAGCDQVKCQVGNNGSKFNLFALSSSRAAILSFFNVTLIPTGSSSLPFLDIRCPGAVQFNYCNWISTDPASLSRVTINCSDLANLTFSNCFAYVMTGDVNFIYGSGWDVVAFTNSTFLNCIAGLWSCGVFWLVDTNSVELGNSTFVNCSTIADGGVGVAYGVKQHLVVSHSYFVNCSTLGGCGGVMWVDAPAPDQGQYTCEVNITYSGCSNCLADVQGGCFRIGENIARLNVSYSSFLNCSAWTAPGGGCFCIALTANVTTFWGCVFNNSSTVGNGGAILYNTSRDGINVIYRCTFITNKASTGPDGGSDVYDAGRYVWNTSANGDVSESCTDGGNNTFIGRKTTDDPFLSACPLAISCTENADLICAPGCVHSSYYTPPDTPCIPDTNCPTGTLPFEDRCRPHCILYGGGGSWGGQCINPCVAVQTPTGEYLCVQDDD